MEKHYNMYWQFTLPTALTLIRLILSPVLMPALICWLLPRQKLVYNIVIVGVFGLFSLTDFFDGYYARAWGQTSALGALLDPLADKMLVVSTIIALLAVKRIPLLGALVFIGRELLITGLREITMTYGIVVPVMMLGKYKTAAQMCYLAIAILNTHPRACWYSLTLERILYILALILTIASAVVYYSYGVKQLAMAL
jgi:CDP-diacylglycerol--glycerol-3-phosphate 3-phosphatidyltransferase